MQNADVIQGGALSAATRSRPATFRERRWFMRFVSWRS
jgi:hypothetical protein